MCCENTSASRKDCLLAVVGMSNSSGSVRKGDRFCEQARHYGIEWRLHIGIWNTSPAARARRRSYAPCNRICSYPASFACRFVCISARQRWPLRDALCSAHDTTGTWVTGDNASTNQQWQIYFLKGRVQASVETKRTQKIAIKNF